MTPIRYPLRCNGPPGAPTPDQAPEPPPRSWQTQADLHRMILDRLGPSPLAEDQLLRDLDLSPQQVQNIE